MAIDRDNQIMLFLLLYINKPHPKYQLSNLTIPCIILLCSQILYWLSGDKSTEKIKTFAQTANSVHLEGLYCWTQYSIQVKGFNSAGDGPLSDEVENRTLEGGKWVSQSG